MLNHLLFLWFPGLAESTHAVLQFLLEEQPPGFTTSSETLWQLLHGWLVMAGQVSPLGRSSRKESSTTVLVRLLCGEQALLQKYIGVYRKEQAIILVRIVPQLSLCVLLHMLRHQAALRTIVNIPAFSVAILDQLAGLTLYLDSQVKSQRATRANSSSSSTSISRTATCGPSSLDHLQLGFSYKCLAAEGTPSIPGDARRKAVETHMAFLKAKPKRAAKCSNNSSVGGEQTSWLEVWREGVWSLLVLFFSNDPSHTGSQSEDLQPVLSHAAMQLVLEASVLEETAAGGSSSSGLAILKEQAARSCREQRSLFLSSKGQLLLEVLWLTAVDNYKQQQKAQQRMQHLVCNLELLFGLVRTGPESTDSKEGMLVVPSPSGLRLFFYSAGNDIRNLERSKTRCRVCFLRMLPFHVKKCVRI